MSLAPLPIAAEVRLTRAYISSQHNRIRDTEQQIHDLEGQNAALREDITRFRDDITQKEVFIAPIRRLPFEVLGEIAVLVATHPTADVRVLRTLSSVCRAWRDATLRTPRAWSRIIFSYRTSARRHCLCRILCTFCDLREWFARSGSCPKDVYLRFDDMPEPEVDIICALLCEHAAELRSLSVWFRLGRIEARVRNCLATQPLPLLEQLDFTSSLQFLDRGVLDSVVNSAPRLARVAVGRLEFDLGHALRMRLTSLAITETTLPKLLAIVRTGDGLPMLRALDVYSLFQRVDLSTNGLQPVETQLQTLHMRLADQATPTLFRVLRVPHLEKLAMSCNYGQLSAKKDAFAMFDSLITTSNPPLSELYLKWILLSDADLLKLLAQLPSLERLIIHEAKTSDRVCEGLSTPRPKRSDWLCPRLTHLCFSTEVYTKSAKFRVSRWAMEQLAEARRSEDAVSTLRAVRLETSALHRVAEGWLWKDDPERDLLPAMDVMREPLLVLPAEWWVLAKCHSAQSGDSWAHLTLAFTQVGTKIIYAASGPTCTDALPFGPTEFLLPDLWPGLTQPHTSEGASAVGSVIAGIIMRLWTLEQGSDDDSPRTSNLNGRRRTSAVNTSSTLLGGDDVLESSTARFWISRAPLRAS